MTIESNPAPHLRVTWLGLSVVGCVRANNEDSLWAGALADAAETGRAQEGRVGGWAATAAPGVLLAVADGMGGAKAGEVASGMAVTLLAEDMVGRVDGDAGVHVAVADRVRALVKSVELANVRIRDEGANDPTRRGMGTTLTAVWLFGDHALMAHVGDSRAYLFRKGNLEQLTKDQSLVEKLLEDKIISQEEADRMAARNIILQALGSEEDLDVAAPQSSIQDGDTLLLCTDGLTGVVPNPEIEESLRLGGSLDELCQRLVDAAEANGGPDNITVLIGRVENEHRAT